MMASSCSSPIRLFLFAMLALLAYSESVDMVNELRCPRREDSYSWARARDCRSCANKLESYCYSLNKEVRNLDCTPRGYSVICECCCTPSKPPPPPPSPPPPSPPPPSPPPPSPPPPSPPPPSPPPPTPTEDKCQPGDMYSEISNPTTECTWCKDWCKNDCSEQEAEMVSNTCSIGQSKYFRTCKCCCREKPPLPPPAPTVDTCDKPGDMYSEITNPTTECTWCKDWCKNDCSEQGGEMVANKCSIGPSKYFRRCQCCCQENSEPSPPPPPPPPAPIKDTCVKPGDSYTETTYATSNCNDCDNWCKNDCSKQGAEVVNQKCSVPGQSSWLRRCECCCNKPSPPPPPPPPAPIKDTCVKPGDSYTETTYATSNCNDCDNWCKNDCTKQGAEVVNQKCSVPGQSQWLRRCECCCNKNVKPSSPPPSPPTPTRDTCDKPGDISTETTIISSDCKDCKTWCEDDCSELGGVVVSNTCSIGESKYARRCKCCCNENSMLKLNTVKDIARLIAH